jgi:tRNA A-37 threonylcarbamoyl transferase component Bud32
MKSEDTTGNFGSAAIEGIPGYRVLQLIERGGMGAVYLAEDQTLQRRVAIKIIHPEFTDDPDYQKRFTREALMVAAFRHSNIVTVYASGWLQGKQYIVMEYVAGGNLHERLLSSRPTPAQAIGLASQLADALAYAHARDVIHRDFKPRNVLLREDSTPVLSDFGVAKSQATQSSQTAVGLVIGNVRYMAPEQALGEAVTDRIDIYSLGLVLFEMLTGDLALTHPVRTRQDQRAIVRLVGSELGDFIARCLDVRPASRPSAAQSRDWLAAYAHRPAAAGPSRRALLGIAAGVVTAIAAGSLAWRAGLVRPARPPVTATGTATSTANLTLSITRLPAAARIFVDAKPLAADSIELAAGSHEIVAVAGGYYGEVRHVTLAAGNPADSLSFALEPTRLPTADEQQRFLKLADAKQLTQSDLSQVEEHTLSAVLQAKQLHQAGQTAQFEAVSTDVETLRRFGDARAAVASLLIGSVLSGHVNRSQVTQSLIAASAAGDAMASLYIAVAYRESINAADRPVPSGDPLYRSYCQHLALAIRQGWGDVASEYWRHDGCATDAGT